MLCKLKKSQPDHVIAILFDYRLKNLIPEKNLFQHAIPKIFVHYTPPQKIIKYRQQKEQNKISPKIYTQKYIDDILAYNLPEIFNHEYIERHTEMYILAKWDHIAYIIS